MADEVRIAVLMPCYNEEITISKVIADFRAALPSANIYVYDNNSTDRSIERAQEVGGHCKNPNLDGLMGAVRMACAGFWPAISGINGRFWSVPT